MQSKTPIDPVGFTNARVLTDAEINEVSGGGLTSPHGTLTGSGGGDPSPVHIQPDSDVSADF
jgi:hypothetical protein